MIPVASLLLIVVLSLLIVRVAAVALRLTGLSDASARFQARSAFTGVGFTTSESEAILGHPLRRRIVMLLMLGGNIGLISVLSSTTLSFVSMQEGASSLRWVLMFGGLAALWALATSRWIDRALSAVISRALDRWTDLDARDYANLLHLSGGYGVVEVAVSPRWGNGRTPADLGLAEHVVLLGFDRVGEGYEGAPEAGTTLRTGDTLYLYGPLRRVSEVCSASGNPM